MGTPSFLALIFLLAVAFQLQLPVAFGQDPATPVLGGDPRAQPLPTVPATPETQSAPTATPAPISPAVGCGIYEILNNDQTTRESGAWIAEYGMRMQILRGSLELQQELLKRVSDALAADPLSKRPADSQILAENLKNRNGASADANGRFKDGDSQAVPASVKQALKDKLRNAVAPLKTRFGLTESSWTSDSQLGDHFIAIYKDPKGLIVTLRLADTAWGPQVYADSYFEKMEPTTGAPKSRMGSLLSFGAPKDPVATLLQDPNFTKGLPGILTTRLDVGSEAKPTVLIRTTALSRVDPDRELDRKFYLLSTGKLREDCAPGVAKPGELAQPRAAVQPVAGTQPVAVTPQAALATQARRLAQDATQAATQVANRPDVQAVVSQASAVVQAAEKRIPASFSERYERVRARAAELAAKAKDAAEAPR